MIVLDTNVTSELMRPEPHPGVVSWVSTRPKETLYTTSINRAEILFGITILPEGRRKDRLASAVEAMFDEDFSGRVLPFDAVAAPHYARIVGGHRRAGSPIDGFDALIAAIALSAGADIATRDAGGVAGCGLTVIDPWRG